jgi:hypothetical protein
LFTFDCFLQRPFAARFESSSDEISHAMVYLGAAKVDTAQLYPSRTIRARLRLRSKKLPDLYGRAIRLRVD